MNEWTLVDTQLTSTSLEELMKIIDDGLCHGFEFKVENGNLFTRMQ